MNDSSSEAWLKSLIIDDNIPGNRNPPKIRYSYWGRGVGGGERRFSLRSLNNFIRFWYQFLSFFLFPIFFSLFPFSFLMMSFHSCMFPLLFTHPVMKFEAAVIFENSRRMIGLIVGEASSSLSPSHLRLNRDKNPNLILPIERKKRKGIYRMYREIYWRWARYSLIHLSDSENEYEKIDR